MHRLTRSQSDTSLGFSFAEADSRDGRLSHRRSPRNAHRHHQCSVEPCTPYDGDCACVCGSHHGIVEFYQCENGGGLHVRSNVSSSTKVLSLSLKSIMTYFLRMDSCLRYATVLVVFISGNGGKDT